MLKITPIEQHFAVNEQITKLKYNLLGNSVRLGILFAAKLYAQKGRKKILTDFPVGISKTFVEATNCRPSIRYNLIVAIIQSAKYTCHHNK